MGENLPEPGTYCCGGYWVSWLGENLPEPFIDCGGPWSEYSEKWAVLFPTAFNSGGETVVIGVSICCVISS
jgi:hypothetical protein